MKKVQSGFTLIELMIVVAIIAILAAIAIPAYNNYIREANMTKVIDHADEAYRLSKAELAKNISIMARGDSPVTITETYLRDEVNPEQRTAPGSSANAFVAGALSGTSTSGQVGIQVVSTSTTTNPARVVVWTPAYLDLTLTSVSIDPSQM